MSKCLLSQYYKDLNILITLVCHSVNDIFSNQYGILGLFGGWTSYKDLFLSCCSCLRTSNKSSVSSVAQENALIPFCCEGPPPSSKKLLLKVKPCLMKQMWQADALCVPADYHSGSLNMNSVCIS